MRHKLIEWFVTGSAVLLVVIYIVLNSSKLEYFKNTWVETGSGKAAPLVQLAIAGTQVYQQRLKASEIYDTKGLRQIYFMHLPKAVFARAHAETEDATLLYKQQEIPLSKTKNSAALLAVTRDERIYLLAEDELKYMMTVIWNERFQANNIVQCANLELCKSVAIKSKFWGPVQGPFLDTDFSPDRRGMPKGRWTMGPKTTLDIMSTKPQVISLQLNLLGVLADQELDFRGAVTRVQKPQIEAEPRNIGGKSLHPAAYVVSLDLKPGLNYLEIIYSSWEKPLTESANPLAAYLTSIVIREAE